MSSSKTKPICVRSLREHCRKMGWSQVDLAKQTGISRTSVNKHIKEGEEVRNILATYFDRYVDVFGIDAIELAPKPLQPSRATGQSPESAASCRYRLRELMRLLPEACRAGIADAAPKLLVPMKLQVDTVFTRWIESRDQRQRPGTVRIRLLSFKDDERGECRLSGQSKGSGKDITCVIRAYSGAKGEPWLPLDLISNRGAHRFEATIDGDGQYIGLVTLLDQCLLPFADPSHPHDWIGGDLEEIVYGFDLPTYRFELVSTWRHSEVEIRKFEIEDKLLHSTYEIDGSTYLGDGLLNECGVGDLVDQALLPGDLNDMMRSLAKAAIEDIDANPPPYPTESMDAARLALHHASEMDNAYGHIVDHEQWLRSDRFYLINNRKLK